MRTMSIISYNEKTFGCSQRKPLFFLVGLFATLFASFFGRGINIYASIFVLILYSLLVFNPEELVGPLLFMTVFDEFFLVSPGQSYSRFLSIMFLVGCVLKFAKKTNNLVFDYYDILLLLSSTISIVLSFIPFATYTSFPLTFLSNVMLCFFLKRCECSRGFLFDRVKLYLILSFFVFLILSIINIKSIFDSSKLIIDSSVNENEFAFSLSFLFSCFVPFLYWSKRHKLFYFVSLFLLVVMVLLTGSRTSLIAAFGSLIIITFIYFYKKNKVINFVYAVFSLFVVAFITFGVLKYFFPSTIERFSISSVLESGGTHRLEIWNIFFYKVFPNRWLLGVGFDPRNFKNIIESFLGKPYGAHNFIVEILGYSGIVGGVVFFVTIFNPFIRLLQFVKKQPMILVPLSMLSCVIIDGIGENILLSRFLWISIGLGLFLISNLKKGTKNEVCH